MTTAAVLAVAAVGGAALGWVYRRDFRRAAARRKSIFEECHGLLDAAELMQVGPDYPVLTGKRNGWEVELKPLADTVQLRKLPVLWLLVTLRRPIAIGGALSMMVRPNNTEFYSGHARLREVLPTPPDWPEDAVVRTDRRELGPPLVERLKPHVAALCAEGRCKEIFVSPRGVRIVHRLDESQRGHYLVTRQPLFEQDRIPRETAEALIGRAVAIAAAAGSAA